MIEKRALYFEAGAKEVWLCDENGFMSFFNSEKQLTVSELVPKFPLKVDI
jgi:Uma2 family endonuclease